MTTEFRDFLMGLRRLHLGIVAEIERLLGIAPKMCPHCNKPYRD